MGISFIKFINILKNNLKVLENYVMMTILQVLNTFFYLLIYPYAIRTLGIENYGIFVYATGVANYFLFFINFGFDLPMTKVIAENLDNEYEININFSKIFFAKIYLFILATIIFTALLNNIEILNNNIIVCIISYIATISAIFFPQWFFQAVQNMKLVTFIQLGVKIITLPLIFYLVKDKTDLNTYALIISFGTIFGSLIAFGLILIKYKIKIKFFYPLELIYIFKSSFPYFLTSLASSIKEYSIPILLGTYFGMKEVAIYDLANKLIQIPRTLVMSINAAIFPKLITNINLVTVRNIIKIEFILSILIISMIVLVGRYAVVILGGLNMIDSYYLAILLSITILTWLVVGAYINFVFIPNNKLYWITHNQFLALISFFMIFFILMYSQLNNIYLIGIAIGLSGLLEIVYCWYMSKKYKLL